MIDIFSDNPTVNDAYIAAVVQAKADNPDWVVQCRIISNPLWMPSSAEWNWMHLIYRIHPQHKPKIAAGWNPLGLTDEQVGVKDGWRLLTHEEINKYKRTQQKPFSDIQDRVFTKNDWRPIEQIWHWENYCFRTRAAPKKRVPLTMQDLPPGFWVKDNAIWRSVESISEKGIRIFYEESSSFYSYRQLFELGFVYSTDRKEEKPFWKYEE